MAEPLLQPPNAVRICPRCGSPGKLYRTPRGLRCEHCVKDDDSGGLSFR